VLLDPLRLLAVGSDRGKVRGGERQKIRLRRASVSKMTQKAYGYEPSMKKNPIQNGVRHPILHSDVVGDPSREADAKLRLSSSFAGGINWEGTGFRGIAGV
jgi:hypothetical protein